MNAFLEIGRSFMFKRMSVSIFFWLYFRNLKFTSPYSVYWAQVPSGELPRSISLTLSTDLINRCSPGDRVGVTAIYRCQMPQFHIQIILFWLVCIQQTCDIPFTFFFLKTKLNSASSGRTSVRSIFSVYLECVHVEILKKTCVCFCVSVSMYIACVCVCAGEYVLHNSSYSHKQSCAHFESYLFFQNFFRGWFLVPFPILLLWLRPRWQCGTDWVTERTAPPQTSPSLEAGKHKGTADQELLFDYIF